MEITKGYNIYSAPVANFQRRLWLLFAPYLIVYIIMLIPMLFNLGGFKPIIISYFLFVVSLTLLMLRNCHKWSLRKISRIRVTEGKIELEVCEKNHTRNYTIPLQNLRVTSKRIGGRPRLLKLTIYDLERKIVDIYSATSKEISDLESIKHWLEKQMA